MSALRNPIQAIRRIPGKLMSSIRTKDTVEDEGPTYVGFSRDDSLDFDMAPFNAGDASVSARVPIVAVTDAMFSPTPGTDPNSDSGHGSSASDFVDANSDIDYDDSDSDFGDDHFEPESSSQMSPKSIHGSSPLGFVDANSDIDYDDDDSDYDEPQSWPEMSVKPKSEPAVDLLDLPTNVLENIIGKLDTGSLHAFRNTSRQAAKAAEFRGIQCHLLHVDPDMAPGQVHSTQKRGKIITRASFDAVMNTERVKVRHLLKIGAFHAASTQLIADHIDSRFKSIVLEGHIQYKTLYSLIVPGKTITMRLKDGIRLPSSDASRFWDYFPGQPISEVCQWFNSNHVIVKATYNATTESHSLRVVKCNNTRLTFDL